MQAATNMNSEELVNANVQEIVNDSVQEIIKANLKKLIEASVQNIIDGEKPHEKLLRLPEVLDRIPVSINTWWRWIREGKAPAGLKLGSNSTAWRESDIDKFIADLGEE